MKKIIPFLILSILFLGSCGKKSEPVYKEKTQLNIVIS
jgi:PBP1b-binding outer membrane lipoprotein LpoB